MDPSLPAALRTAMEAMTEGRSGRELGARSAEISRLYRAHAPSSRAVTGADDALAYALTRMPATYAAVGAALEAVMERAPGFAPATLLDAGCGPGTAAWAACEAFASLEGVRLADKNGPLMMLARRLMESSPVPIIGTRFGDITSAQAFQALHDSDGEEILPTFTSDLVILAYALVELQTERIEAVTHNLWAATTGVLLIVEPGTPDAWARLMRIRSTLIEAGGTVIAPCPHYAPCPLAPPDWCHFSQRLPRSRAHLKAKGASAPFEDEKFAYLAVARPGVALDSPRPRVLAPPMEDKAGITLKLCTDVGALAARRFARRDKPAFKAVRKAGWGDTI